jgi:hypothetical protein
MKGCCSVIGWTLVVVAMLSHPGALIVGITLLVVAGMINSAINGK